MKERLIINLLIKPMKLRDVGEKKIVRMILDRLSIENDDCAVFEMDDEYILLTTDMVYEKTHFPEGTPPYYMGWYSTAVNLSDIAAKGGTPEGILLAMGLPRAIDEEFLEEILNGVEDCLRTYGGRVYGGDTKENDRITISITAFGRVKKEEFMARKGANIGDAVYVTGSLGRGAYLYEGKVEEMLYIKPRLMEGRVLAKLKCVSSCMDISDGLAISLYELSRINDVGFRIYHHLLPIASVAKKYENYMDFALYHGGDFELLFTSPCKIKMEGITKIGEVIKEKKIVLIKGEREIGIEEKGYEHFKYK